MNLIKQLQKSHKWDTFEKWYFEQPFIISFFGREYFEETCNIREVGFIDLFDKSNFCFTKGVIEMFVNSQGYQVHFDGSYCLYKYKDGTYEIESESDGMTEFQRLLRRDSFEELLIWYFNNL